MICMVKGNRAEMFCTLPDKCMELQAYLDEGLFVKDEDAIGNYGTGITTYTPASGTIKHKVGMPLMPVSGKDRTYKASDDGNFIAVIRADPEGIPPVQATDDLRQALIQFIQAGYNYHIPLADNNQAIVAGDFIGVTVGSDGTVSWDKGDGTSNVTLIAVEGASANSGKYIDAYCVSVVFPSG